MRRLAFRLAMLAATVSLTSGCVAAVAPIAAAGAVGGKRLSRRHAAAAAVAAQPQAPPAVVTGADPAPAGMQYLYGSGEAAAITVQAWRGLVEYVADQVRARPTDSVVLTAEATLAAPTFVPCGSKPFAAVFDVDETVLLNQGAEYDAATHPGPFDPKRWEAWERTGGAALAPTPGAAKALAALRAMGVTVIFNTNRSAANAAATERTLTEAGLGPAEHGRTLYLSGDDATGSHKDGRRATVAARYCVLAMAGDQLGDFSDLFNAPALPLDRRALTTTAAMARLWGAGWFVMPNPVYGTALKGSVDEVFPADKRWSPTEDAK